MNDPVQSTFPTLQERYRYGAKLRAVIFGVFANADFVFNGQPPEIDAPEIYQGAVNIGVD
ncbi:hypothetical protein [Nereida sp.]|uniref:hypothetical protein n=1 Tax=Nereida sp. TaxID=2736090 RepID=UPI003F697166